MKYKNEIMMFITGLLYFSVVLIFLMTKTFIALAIWEIVTILSAVVFIFYFNYIMKLLKIELKRIKLINVFLIMLLVLTSIAHLSSVCVTQPLLLNGVDVPSYLLIGKYPSIEMFVDYAGWGLSLGLVFILISHYASTNNKCLKIVKALLLMMGIMCLIGFAGGLTPIQELWYIATFAYGFMPVVLSIILIIYKRKED